MTTDPYDRPTDPFYAPKPAWEARGDIAPTDHTDWETVETFKPRHRYPEYDRPRALIAWEDHPQGGPLYLAHTPRHRATS